MNEVEAVRVEGESAVDVVKLDSNASARSPSSRNQKHPEKMETLYDWRFRAAPEL